jgi:acyl-CoA reductase-like NAD-dependent aldehyde dehydrogenase
LQTPLAGTLDASFAGSSIRYEPVGVVVGITPWNFPLMMAAWKVGPSLAAGCTIVIKPSEFTPFSTLELAAAAEAIGLPPGVLSVVNGFGPVGAHMIRHPLTDKVSFTGRCEAGGRGLAACTRSELFCGFSARLHPAFFCSTSHSVATGTKVMQTAAEGIKRVTLELGGKYVRVGWVKRLIHGPGLLI